MSRRFRRFTATERVFLVVLISVGMLFLGGAAPAKAERMVAMVVELLESIGLPLLIRGAELETGGRTVLKVAIWGIISRKQERI